MKAEYFVMWREDYEDMDGWFTEVEALSLVNRIWALEAEGESGEPSVYRIIKGQDLTEDFGK